MCMMRTMPPYYHISPPLGKHEAVNDAHLMAEWRSVGCEVVYSKQELFLTARVLLLTDFACRDPRVRRLIAPFTI